jgi:hypothetical protein
MRPYVIRPLFVGLDGATDELVAVHEQVSVLGEGQVLVTRRSVDDGV